MQLATTGSVSSAESISLSEKTTSAISAEREKKIVGVQLRTMDHLARIAMKNAANCVKYGELQGSRNRYMSNAYCGPVIHLPGPRLSEGLLQYSKHSRKIPRRVCVSCVLGFTSSSLAFCKKSVLCAVLPSGTLCALPEFSTARRARSPLSSP